MKLGKQLFCLNKKYISGLPPVFYLCLNKTIQRDIKAFGRTIAECVDKCIHPNAVQSIAGRGVGVGVQSAFPANTGSQSHQNGHGRRHGRRHGHRQYAVAQNVPRIAIISATPIEPQQVFFPNRC